jgi:molecular chaperone HscB
MSRDAFKILGIGRAFHLDADELERRYLALSRQLHPDRFAKALPRERLLATSKTTELNDAYKILKNDIKRAEYILKQEGYDLADEKSSSVKADPQLLVEMMELNERLADGDNDALTGEVRARRAQSRHDLDERFSAFEAGDQTVLPELAQVLVAMRYYDRFLARAAPHDDGEGDR